MGINYTTNYNLQKQAHGDINWDVPINETLDIIDGQMKVISDKIGNINLLNTEDKTSTVDAINSHLEDYVRQPGYAVATGSANTYVVTLNPAPVSYVDGMGVYVKINIENTDASTINVNGLGAKSIKDSGGNNIVAGALKANIIYALRYESTSGNFILASSSNIVGDATPEDLLAPKTATTLAGQITGQMINNTNAGIVITPSTVDQAVPQGYVDGQQSSIKVAGDTDLISDNIKATKSVFGITGKSTVVDTEDATALVSQLLAGVSAYVNGSKLVGSMVNNGSVVITPGTSNITIAKGYHDGNGYVKGDTNLVSQYIVSGHSIFNVAGSATVASLGGYLVGMNTLNAGSTMFLKNETAVEKTDIYGWTKFKETRVYVGGTITVQHGAYLNFYLTYTTGVVYSQIWVNGVARGTVRTSSYSTLSDGGNSYPGAASGSWTENISVNAGDYIQIYAYGTVTGTTGVSKLDILTSTDPASVFGTILS